MNKELNLFNKKIDKFEEDISTCVKVGHAQSNTIPSSDPALANFVKRDSMTKYQIRVSGMKELEENLNHFERQEKDLKNIKLLLKHIDKETCKIADCFRLGRCNKDRQRPRSILVTFTCVWDRNMVIQSSKLLKNFPDKIFIVPALTPSEMEIERKILKGCGS